MTNNTHEKTCARRFAYSASGVVSYYLACDLDKAVLRYWWKNGPDPYWQLLMSSSYDEHVAYYLHKQLCMESEECIGIKLNDDQIAYMEGLLTSENIESMRGVDDDTLHERSAGWCYRDGWRITFYAEGDAGWPPLKLKGLSCCSFTGNELPFEKLEDYINTEILGNSH